MSRKRGVIFFILVFLVLFLGIVIAQPDETDFDGDLDIKAHPECELIRGYWGTYTVNEGDKVELIVEAADDCEGKQINFEIYRDPGGDYDTDGLKIVSQIEDQLVEEINGVEIINGKAFAKWTVPNLGEILLKKDVRPTTLVYFIIFTLFLFIFIFGYGSLRINKFKYTSHFLFIGIALIILGFMLFIITYQAEERDIVSLSPGFIDYYFLASPADFPIGQKKSWNLEVHDSNYEETSDCPYGDDETLSFIATCDFRLSHQNKYVDENYFTLEELEGDYGITNDALTLGGFALALPSDITIDELLDLTEENVRTSIQNYLDGRPWINPNTKDLIILDIEKPVHMQHIGSYENDTELQTQIIEAYSMIIGVSREEFPEAKLALFNTIVSQTFGNGNSDGFQQALRGYQRAGEQGMYDNLDYLMPNLFFKWGPTDEEVIYVEPYVRLGIETSANLTNSMGEHLPLTPILSHTVLNSNSNHDNKRPDKDVVRQVINIIQEYDEVEIIDFWTGATNRLNIAEFYRNVKPVPRACFCDVPEIDEQQFILEIT